ncbi:MAG: hypothetical protein NVS4B8_12360 [Herpetosiphon sp.]
MRSRIALLVVFVLVACGWNKPPASTKMPADARADPTALPAAKVETIGAVDGRLAYVQAGRLYVISAGGASQIDVGGVVGAAAWSHDGARLAIIRRGNSFADLYIYTLATKTWTRITKNSSKLQPGTREYVHEILWSDRPTWSPDDTEVIFMAQGKPATTENAAIPIYEHPFDLYRYKLKLVGQREPTADDNVPIESDDDLLSPAWSPDGKQLAYVNVPRRSGERQIMRFSFTDKSAKPFPGVPPNAYDPAWSPDSTRLAFAASEGTATDVWIVDLGGGNPQRVTRTGQARAPVWSPTGNKLAWINVGHDQSNLAVADIQMSGGQVTVGEPRPLTQNGQVDANAGLSWTK